MEESYAKTCLSTKDKTNERNDKEYYPLDCKPTRVQVYRLTSGILSVEGAFKISNISSQRRKYIIYQNITASAVETVFGPNM